MWVVEGGVQSSNKVKKCVPSCRLDEARPRSFGSSGVVMAMSVHEVGYCLSLDSRPLNGIRF